MIRQVCELCGLTASFRNPTAPEWNYQFLPAGRTLYLNDTRNFTTLLRQKYLITAYDLGNDTIEFAHYQSDPNQYHNKCYLSLYGYTEIIEDTHKRFIWRDENQTVYYAIPSNRLDTDYYFTWYDSITMSTDIIVAKP